MANDQDSLIGKGLLSAKSSVEKNKSRQAAICVSQLSKKIRS